MGGVTSDIADSLRAHIDKVHADRVKTQYDARQLRGSVTERLSARVEALEATVGRLLANEAKLIADSIAQGQQAVFLADRASGIEDGCQERWDTQSRTNVRIHQRHADFADMSLWQRLRWLALGK
jgi:hypothetical protein